MLGSNNGAAGASRPAAADVARIEGNLTHVLVSGGGPDEIQIFVNGRPIPTGEIESLSVEIVAPGDANPAGAITAMLSRYQTGPTGQREQRGVSLFPGTIELVARDRRVVVTCQQEGAFDGLWLGLGLRADGTSSELVGVESLRLVVTPGLLDAKLVWSENGATEDVLPPAEHPPAAP